MQGDDQIREALERNVRSGVHAQQHRARYAAATKAVLDPALIAP